MTANHATRGPIIDGRLYYTGLDNLVSTRLGE